MTMAENFMQAHGVTNFVLHDAHEVKKFVEKLIPWEIKQLQFASLPRANRHVFGLGATHRATIVKYAHDGKLEFLLEPCAHHGTGA